MNRRDVLKSLVVPIIPIPAWAYTLEPEGVDFRSIPIPRTPLDLKNAMELFSTGSPVGLYSHKIVTIGIDYPYNNRQGIDIEGCIAKLCKEVWRSYLEEQDYKQKPVFIRGDPTLVVDGFPSPFLFLSVRFATQNG